MKNLFKTLFGKIQVKANPEEAIAEKISNLPTQELFINEIDPDNIIPKENGFSRLKKYLNHDHFSEGLKQGYLFHSEVGMQLFVNDLKAKFRLEVNALDEIMRELILSKKKKLIDLGDMLPNIRDQLRIEIDSDEELREELKYQKLISVDGEGWIAQVLYAFEKGFRKGMLDFISINEFGTRGIL